MSETPWERMDRQLVERGAEPATTPNPSLGLVANKILAEPGIVARIIEEGRQAFRDGAGLIHNPYFADGEYGWWADGWTREQDRV